MPDLGSFDVARYTNLKKNC